MSAEVQSMRYVDPDTGFLMHPGSQRPDGSWRKPRRVKEGYTPQDEVPLYESKGKAVAKARESGYIPGLNHPDNVSNFKIDTFVLPTPVVTIPGLNMKATPSQPATSTKTKKKKNKGSGASNNTNDIKDLSDNMKKASITEDRPRNEAGQPIATDPAKKLRNLKKKLRDIEALEEKLTSGQIATPEKEQLDKVARKGDVMREIEALERENS